MSTNPPRTTRRLTTREQRDAMVQDYIAGNPLRTVAANAGVAYSTAHRAVSLAGVQRRHQRKRKTTEAK